MCASDFQSVEAHETLEYLDGGIQKASIPTPPLKSLSVVTRQSSTTQTENFEGLPTPANALFWVGILVAIMFSDKIEIYKILESKPFIIPIISLIFSISFVLLVLFVLLFDSKIF